MWSSDISLFNFKAYYLQRRDEFLSFDALVLSTFCHFIICFGPSVLNKAACRPWTGVYEMRIWLIQIYSVKLPWNFGSPICSYCVNYYPVFAGLARTRWTILTLRLLSAQPFRHNFNKIKSSFFLEKSDENGNDYCTTVVIPQPQKSVRMNGLLRCILYVFVHKIWLNAAGFALCAYDFDIYVWSATKHVLIDVLLLFCFRNFSRCFCPSITF